MPDDDTILVNGAYAMERNVGGAALLVVDGQAETARIEADLGDEIVIESRPRLEGRQMVMMIAPKKK